MKKTILIYLLFFITVQSFAEGNPNWGKGIGYIKKDTISPYLWAPKGIVVAGDMSFFCYDGTYNSIFDYSLSCTAMLSKMFNISTGLASKNFEKYPDTFYAKLQSHPTNYFSFQLDYRSRIFPEYHIATHHIVTALDFYIDKTKWVDFHVITGGSLTFKDIDTRDNGTKFKRDWFFFLNFIYQLRFFVHPLSWLSFGTVFGNYSDYEIHSFDYYQCDTVFEFYPTPDRNLTLIMKFCVINGGGLNFGGYINRLALTFGGRYEIKI